MKAYEVVIRLSLKNCLEEYNSNDVEQQLHAFLTSEIDDKNLGTVSVEAVEVI